MNLMEIEALLKKKSMQCNGIKNKYKFNEMFSKGNNTML